MPNHINKSYTRWDKSQADADWLQLSLPNGTVVSWIDKDGFLGGNLAAGSGAVASVFGRTGAVIAASGDYGAFYDVIGSAAIAQTNAESFTTASLVPFALLASPAFSGVPTAPTAAPATNTTQVATTAFVLANAGGGAPAGSNISLIGAQSNTDNSFSNTTILMKVDANAILNQATKVVVTYSIISGSETIGAAVLRTSAVGATTFDAGSTPITWASSATPTFTGPSSNVSDTITFAVDGTKDVWVVIFIASASGDHLPKFDGYGVSQKWGYASGDHTADSTFPSTTPDDVGISRFQTA
jgi:hypothetical protein